MMVASEAEEAWCPPTFSPSVLSRTWLALWMVQLESQSTFCSSAMRSSSSWAEIVVFRCVFAVISGDFRTVFFVRHELHPLHVLAVERLLDGDMHHAGLGPGA